LVVGSNIVFSGPFTGNALEFGFAVMVPGGQAAAKELTGHVDYRYESMPGIATVSPAPNPLVINPIALHAGDYREPSWFFDGTEVNRIVTYWRTGQYHSDPIGFDGYAPGPGAKSGTRHTADFRPPFWIIDGVELNRALGYWRRGAYHPDSAGYDGYAPGRPP
jgi:hypothetical protein